MRKGFSQSIPSTIAQLLEAAKLPDSVQLGDQKWSILVDRNTPHACYQGKPLWIDEVGGLSVFRQGEKLELYWVEWGDVLGASISFKDHEIIISIGRQTDLATAKHLIADQIFPRILAHQKGLVLHAGAVSIDNQAILFVGRSGIGKSTLTASLAQAGFPLLGDDAIHLSKVGEVASLAQAVYPSLRLLKDSIRAVYGEEVVTSPVASYSEKEHISIIRQSEIEPAPLTLGGLVFLAKDLSQGEIELKEIASAESCMRIISNCFCLNPVDEVRSKRNLMLASDLVESVPIFELAYQRNYSELGPIAALLDRQFSNSKKQAQEGAEAS